MSFLSGIFNRGGLAKLPLNRWPNYLVDIPAIPILVSGVPDTFVRSLRRKGELKQAKWGLFETYSINNRTATAYQFMYQNEEDLSQKRVNSALLYAVTIKQLTQEFLGLQGESTDSADMELLTSFSLDDPEQWTMGWTTFHKVNELAQPYQSYWVSSLTDADEATRQFWPTIAEHGLVYNLLILEKVRDAQFDSIKKVFQSVWTPELDGLYDAGRLYVIDLSIFNSVKPHNVNGFKRFTPSTITLLKQDAQSKAITPLAIHVSGYEGANAQIYTREGATESAWLYALQAAKVSVTVYGIWLGHVYHWHIVTAAMQMTMYETFSDEHPIYQLLAPQSNYLIAFDTLLLALWKLIAPPTSINSGNEFLQLCNSFAKGRDFFDDDPLTTLDRFGLEIADFTESEAWDLYPIVPHYLKIWDATESYVNTFVEVTYSDNKAVVDDKMLQKWIQASKDKGNIRGLPTMNSKEALKQVLTSLIYRITIHGACRLHSDSMPALTFVANFPSCLQSSDIPSPDSEFDTKTLLSYLPKTGSIGKMLNFYFVFIFSVPYEPFIPLDGIESQLFFENPNDERNQALIAYRKKVIEAMEDLQHNVQIHQWPLNIET